MPSGKTLQLGSIHQYKDNFSKPYNIKYETEDGTHNNCHQTTFGMSERILGALIGIHGDDKGLVLPPAVAPIQVVIIPIIFKDKGKNVLDVADDVYNILSKGNIRTHFDEREINPGNKYYDWELKGVPIRIEIGPRDVDRDEIVVVRRDNGDKKSIPTSDILNIIKNEIEMITHDLYNNAKNKLDKNIHQVITIDDAKEKKGVIELPWCGNMDCALKIENILDGNTLGEPIGKNISDDPCPVCYKNAIKWMRYAKTY
jgi:prolyl-tRNA synthetase